MKKFFHCIFSLLFITSYAFAQDKYPIITIKNGSSIERADVLVSIPWTKILKADPKIDTAKFLVMNKYTETEVPHQLEYKGEKEVQNLLLQVSVKAKEHLTLIIFAAKPKAVTPKTYARYVPERKDDFAWENDKIAFRMYGKALEKTSEDAYGIDVWVKRTSKLVINDRYKKNDYHKDHGDGLDYYSVGFTLGAGGMAPYVKDSVRYSGNYKTSKVLDNGPLRSSFQLTYDEWDAAGIKVKVTKTISIDAGSQLNRIENLYTFSAQGKNLPVAIGLSTRNENEKKLLLDKNGILGYWEPVHGDDGITGVGAVTLNSLKSATAQSKQALGITEVKNNVPYVYYAGAAWNKAGKITNENEWFSYLQKYQNELKSPLKVSVK
ncbi:DUF4861 domain-containing protein [Pedobacter chinensis]|uniref:DUF4861 domain-containing protein n=1 Tax=Pedobacter chinensis TaxID=2282421 RepID=A0A369PQJ6_9SPHI|nr:DUF4861 family protein [Pedobacter chinensis]RDC54540.1 DUF4861 domain-containing protein [Pedobacter chinensis]